MRILGPEIRAPLYALTGEMRERYLMPTTRGERESCFAQTEPDAGSDPGAMRTTAVRDGDHYVINGVKRFITGADLADFVILMAATDRSKGSRGGISCFVFDMDTPGVKLTTCYQTLTGETPWEIVFDNVRVHERHLVGEEGKGFSLGQKWLGAGRIKQAARALGATRRCLELATAYAKQRVTFGQPIASRQAISFRLVDTYVALEAATLAGASRRRAPRPRRWRPQRSLHGQALLHRDGVGGRRHVPAGARRHRAHHRPAGRAAVARPAQPHDHRRHARDHAHGARAPCAGYVWVDWRVPRPNPVYGHRPPFHQLDAGAPRIGDVGDRGAGQRVLAVGPVELDALRFDPFDDSVQVLHVEADMVEHATACEERHGW